MIQLVYGDDRVKAQQAIIKALGAGYETIEADGLTRGDMDSIFHGVSIFGDHHLIPLWLNLLLWNILLQALHILKLFPPKEFSFLFLKVHESPRSL